MLKQKKKSTHRNMGSETGKGIPTQGDSPAEALGTLSHRKEMSQAHSPFSHSEVSRGSKDYLLGYLRQTSPTQRLKPKKKKNLWFHVAKQPRASWLQG